jgi:hypothetical protein
MTLQVLFGGEVRLALAKMGKDGGCAANAAQLKNQLLQPILARSATARRVYNALQLSPHRFGIAFVEGGNCETIFDPDLLTIFFRVDQPIYFAPPLPAPVTQVPQEIVLYHELGHAKQFLDNARHYQKMIDWSFGHPITRIRTFPNGSQTTTRDRQNRFQKSGYFQALESDNLTKHEWPICAELGFPQRTSYPQFCGSAAKAIIRRRRLVHNSRFELTFHQHQKVLSNKFGRSTNRTLRHVGSPPLGGFSLTK